ncbi:SDR family oxidoreductase [bacterium]|nr:SDR family oxidoreductase [bacterium]
MKLKGKVAIITGAASGIGEAIAMRYAEEGASVCIPDRNYEGALKVATKITKLEGNAFAIETDVTDALSVEKAVSSTINKFGKIDILVNNAGISWSKKILDLNNEEWNLMIQTHLNGCFYFSKEVASYMVSRSEGGKILNISSVSGIVGSVGRGPYGAAKAGIISLTRIMAVEFAEYRINVNALAPGPILTPMMQPIWEDVKEYPRDVPLKRFGTPEEVAHAALFLCSDQSDYITGIVLPIDGGFSIAGKIDRTLPKTDLG